LEGPGSLLDLDDRLLVGAFPLPLGSWGASTALSCAVLTCLMSLSVLEVLVILTAGGGVLDDGLDGMELVFLSVRPSEGPHIGCISSPVKYCSSHGEPESSLMALVLP
jgi:hypothetical protein